MHIDLRGVELQAIMVIDNLACGPSIGGARMASDVGVVNCVRLDRAMTLKNAAAGLPHGGGKLMIFGDPRMSFAEKERLIRTFAGAIRELFGYIVEHQDDAAFASPSRSAGDRIIPPA